MDRVFVTGATGMVGSRLVQRLSESGVAVRALVRSTSHVPFARLPSVECVIGDLDNVDVLARAMDGCRRVFHVAGLVSYRPGDAERLYRTNVVGTRNVLAAALEASAERVVYTSSTAAVGLSDAPRTLDETEEFDPRLRAIPYMWMKHLAEIEVAEAAAIGLDVISVNPSTIIGTGDVNRNAGRLFRQLARGAIRAAPPGGNSVVALDDVVSGHLLAMERGVKGRRYILSTENLTHQEMLSRISRTLGRPPVNQVLPSWTERPAALAASLASWTTRSALTAQVVYFSYRFRWFNAQRARIELGWDPRISLEQASSDAAQFYAQEGIIAFPRRTNSNPLRLGARPVLRT